MSFPRISTHLFAKCGCCACLSRNIAGFVIETLVLLDIVIKKLTFITETRVLQKLVIDGSLFLINYIEEFVEYGSLERYSFKHCFTCFRPKQQILARWQWRCNRWFRHSWRILPGTSRAHPSLYKNYQWKLLKGW